MGVSGGCFPTVHCPSPELTGTTADALQLVRDALALPPVQDELGSRPTTTVVVTDTHIRHAGCVRIHTRQLCVTCCPTPLQAQRPVFIFFK